MDIKDWIRVDDFADLRKGDVLVARGGNRYTVARMHPETDYRDAYCEVWLDFAGRTVQLIESSFDYALREPGTVKPSLPDKPGLWQDKHGDLWVWSAMSGNPTLTRIREHEVWRIGSDKTVDEVAEHAPFHPMRTIRKES